MYLCLRWGRTKNQSTTRLAHNNTRPTKITAPPKMGQASTPFYVVHARPRYAQQILSAMNRFIIAIQGRFSPRKRTFFRTEIHRNQQIWGDWLNHDWLFDFPQLIKEINVDSITIGNIWTNKTWLGIASILDSQHNTTVVPVPRKSH